MHGRGIGEPAFRRLRGAEIAGALDALAALRIEVFRAWPYLYDGDLAYERDYLARYARTPDAFAFLVEDGGRAVGATTGMPLADEDDALRRPFERAGRDVGRIFYCAESVLLPAWRGRGLYHRFFDEREAFALGLGRFDAVAFCGVVRPDDHPARPAGYRPLDPIWERRGYRRASGIVARFPWRDVGDEAETEKTMQFWLRDL